MWVRNQNKILLVDSYIFNIQKDNDKFIVLSGIEEKLFPVGYYETEEKAMSILDEIQRQIIIINGSNFYQMPIDTED